MQDEQAGGPEGQQHGEAPGQQPVSHKPRRKALAIALSAGALVVVAAAVLVALSTTGGGGGGHEPGARGDGEQKDEKVDRGDPGDLEREDYELAASFTDTTMGFFEVIVTDVDSTLYATREGGSVKAEAEGTRDSAVDFDDHLHDMRDLAAITDDPEIAALFEEFETAMGTKRDHLVKTADAAVSFGKYHRACHGNSSDPVSQMRLGMSSADLDQVMADLDTSQTACTDALTALADGDHESFREPADALLELWPPVRDATEQLGQAAVANDQARIATATEAMTAAQDTYDNAKAGFDGSFRQLSDEAQSQESGDALLAALEKKITQF